MNEKSSQPILVIAENTQDFAKIGFAASGKDVTISEVDDAQLVLNADRILDDKKAGDRVLEISFNDSNGTRQSFLDKYLELSIKDI